ncbi:MAG TPA: class I SAM-dependent methyltransferase [Usitatibacter sp.]|nr:class I SAM-dependent methyltransferase [Usitatibacter sp.]
MEELERFVPGTEGQIWYEHWHRYHFATAFAAGRSVVDAACGEGYGSALLARAAAHVTGVDASAETVALARRRYGAAANLEFVEGRCESLPVKDASVDLLVSFETLEHLEDPRALIAEAARVLRRDGVFVVSTPNKALYTDKTGYHNPYHPSEMYEAGFVEALGERFPHARLFGQRVDVYSAVWPLEARAASAQLLQARADSGADAVQGVPDPIYFIAVCASTAEAIERIGAPFSLLADQDHRVWSGCENLERLLAEARVHAERVEKAYLEAQARLAMLLQERERRAAAAPAPAGSQWPPR